jgi:hypothetical protein
MHADAYSAVAIVSRLGRNCNVTASLESKSVERDIQPRGPRGGILPKDFLI